MFGGGGGGCCVFVRGWWLLYVCEGWGLCVGGGGEGVLVVCFLFVRWFLFCVWEVVVVCVCVRRWLYVR